MIKIRYFWERLTFVPWYLFQIKVLRKTINLERLYNAGYCSERQYGILKGIRKL